MPEPGTGNLSDLLQASAFIQNEIDFLAAAFTFFALPFPNNLQISKEVAPKPEHISPVWAFEFVFCNNHGITLGFKTY